MPQVVCVFRWDGVSVRFRILWFGVPKIGLTLTLNPKPWLCGD